MRYSGGSAEYAYCPDPSKKGTLQSLCARMGKIRSGEGVIRTDVQKAVMGTNRNGDLKLVPKSHITSHITLSSL